MKVLVGLGNPGTQYLWTRHNAGFLILDLLAQELELQWIESKYGFLEARGSLWDEKIILVKPQTYMNHSGKPVAKFVRFYKLPEDSIVVIHDDVDVPQGKVRMRIGGSAGGHNGIKSLLVELGFTSFFRIKLGVGKPAHETQQGVSNWVLGKFTQEEIDILSEEMYEAVKERLRNIWTS